MGWADYPWQGATVEVQRDGSWRYSRCCVCGQPLTAPESVARGYGPDCRAGNGDEACERRRERVVQQDRHAFVFWRRQVRTMLDMAQETTFAGAFVVDARTGEILRPRLGSEWDAESPSPGRPGPDGGRQPSTGLDGR